MRLKAYFFIYLVLWIALSINFVNCKKETQKKKQKPSQSQQSYFNWNQAKNNWNHLYNQSLNLMQSIWSNAADALGNVSYSQAFGAAIGVLMPTAFGDIELISFSSLTANEILLSSTVLGITVVVIAGGLIYYCYYNDCMPIQTLKQHIKRLQSQGNASQIQEEIKRLKKHIELLQPQFNPSAIQENIKRLQKQDSYFFPQWIQKVKDFF